MCLFGYTCCNTEEPKKNKRNLTEKEKEEAAKKEALAKLQLDIDQRNEKIKKQRGNAHEYAKVIFAHLVGFGGDVSQGKFNKINQRHNGHYSLI